ncbi:MAG: T9SS type A sorting domain-containing protein [Bacteroidia bacterium]
MKKINRLLMAGLLLPFALMASNLPEHHHSHENEKPLAAEARANPATQALLRNAAPWQKFEQQHGNWNVVFNETTGIPSRAFGSPIAVPLNADNVSRARYFLRNALSDYPVPADDLELRSNVSTSKYTYTKFSQYHKGLKILNSNAQVRFNAEGNVTLFQLSVYPDADAATSPEILKEAVSGHLEKFFDHPVKRIEADDELAFLAVPGSEGNDLKLVYQLKVYTQESGRPEGEFKVFLDAQSGAVLYSQSLVHNANSSMNLTATVHETNPLQAAAEFPVPHAEVEINGTTYHTDENGNLDIDLFSATQATIKLSGKWSTVYTGNSSNTVSSFTTTLQPGTNAISFDSDASLRELSAYYHVNKIHDFLKLSIPAFDGMDFSLATRVDRTDGSCNAFYNGSSINFYTPGNGCQAFSLLADVVYHEYGHAINYEFYDWLGEDFENRALGEGYSDIWALAITGEAVLGLGRSLTNNNSYVRRYDADPKVYPQDLTGEVHDDGEIIAGAWWDLGVNLNSLEDMFDIFLEAYHATPNAFAGDEGRLYHDILIDALMADDDDGDLTNGTPNEMDIIDAFARHGITMLALAELEHNEMQRVEANTGITIEATLETDFTSYVKDLEVYYSVGDTGNWQATTMTNTSGNFYSAAIPSQSQGTIVNYYLRLRDTYDNVTQVLPAEADLANSNIPYQILVGYNRFHIEDFDENEGFWMIGQPEDNASTGEWEIGYPQASYLNVGSASPSSQVQTGEDHTTGYGRCAITGNSSTVTAASVHDVDNGITTLISPVFDLSEYDDPVIGYHRWYTNRQGANPGNDYFEAAISDDGGSTWKDVENTNVPDKSWRRYAFKVKDYIDELAIVRVRFIAADKSISGPNSGQSLVEAAIDDLEIFDTRVNTGITSHSSGDLALQVFPNPATGNLRISCNSDMSKGTLRFISVSGKILEQIPLAESNPGILEMNVSHLPAGLYLVELSDGTHIKRVKLSVVK